MIFLQHKGLNCCDGSGGVRPCLMSVPPLEALLTRCFIGGSASASWTQGLCEFDPGFSLVGLEKTASALGFFQIEMISSASMAVDENGTHRSARAPWTSRQLRPTAPTRHQKSKANTPVSRREMWPHRLQLLQGSTSTFQPPDPLNPTMAKQAGTAIPRPLGRTCFAPRHVRPRACRDLRGLAL